MDLIIKPKATKFIKGNIEEHFYELGLGKEFLHATLKSIK